MMDRDKVKILELVFTADNEDEEIKVTANGIKEFINDEVVEKVTDVLRCLAKILKAEYGLDFDTEPVVSKSEPCRSANGGYREECEQK